MKRIAAFTVVECLILVAIVLVLFLGYVGFGTGYDTRRHVNTAVLESGPLAQEVMEFRADKGAWPDAQQAAAMKAGTPVPKEARSIEYDAARKALVITMGREPYEGKRFAFYAEEVDGKPQWTCRAIDIDVKYLPANCR